MSPTTRVSIEEYFTTYAECKPACELIEGEVVQKPMPRREHSRLQSRLNVLLERQVGGGREVLLELSMRVGEDVRIPDISVVSENARDDRGFLLDPPILCVEVISPEQRFSTLLQKCEAYHQFGVPYCWVIDPDRKISWEYHREGTLTQGNEFLTAGDIRISLNELFR